MSVLAYRVSQSREEDESTSKVDIVSRTSRINDFLFVVNVMQW